MKYKILCWLKLALLFAAHQGVDSVPAGKTFKLDGGAFRIIGIDKAFAPTGDTTVNQPVDTVSEGYVLVMSDEEGILKVTECAKEE